MLWRLWASSSGINHFKHGEESWALVTGASDGIGKSVCQAFAQKGFNVILHGRNQEKLNVVKDELQAACPDRKFEIVVADATQGSLAPEVASAVKDKHVTILVNNAGYTSTLIEPLVTQDPDVLQRGVDIGCTWLTQLTRAMLPQLVENKPSAVVNIGSFVAAHPPPFLAVYAGTKGYTRAFSQALRTEMRLTGHKDVDIQYHESHSVATKANGSPVSTAAPDPDTMARSIVVAIGQRKGFIVPYWSHELTNWFLWIMPESWVQKMSGSILQTKRTDLKKAD